jgi:general nucleoside transport system ATP-binding protein
MKARGTVPPLIIANQPTWGLDIGAVAYVHQQLLDAAVAGSAVLVISEDLDEVFALADRIAVMHQGRLSAALPAAQWSRAAMGLAMAGAYADKHAGAHAHESAGMDIGTTLSADPTPHPPTQPPAGHVQA